MALRFEELDIWKQSRELCKGVYSVTNNVLFDKNCRFRDQIRASSGSVMDNIAEGFERNGNKEFIQFLYIAKGSCGEVRSQLYRAIDSKLIIQEEFDVLYNKSMQLSKSISHFIQYLKTSQISGHKNLKPPNP
jgi:four helix bundle protein